jgi:hypothetical protein
MTKPAKYRIDEITDLEKKLLLKWLFAELSKRHKCVDVTTNNREWK